MLIFSYLNSITTWAEHRILELAFSDLRSRDPHPPAFHSLLRFQVLPLDFDTDGEMVPGTKPHFVQEPRVGAQIRSPFKEK